MYGRTNKEINFKEDCLVMKRCLEESYQQVEAYPIHHTALHKIPHALKKPQIPHDLSKQYDYYADENNHEEWCRYVQEHYNYPLVFSMLDFLTSLDLYFKATVSLTALINLKVSAPKVEVYLAYIIWRVRLEDSLLKVDTVLNTSKDE